MTRPTLRYPETVREALQRRYRNRRRNWLAGEDTWPLDFPLGCPSEEEAQLQPEAVREWVQAWRAFEACGDLVWCERRWRTLGNQRLPERLLLQAAEDVAAWVGEEQRWRQARCHYQRLTTHWPALASRLPRHFDALADYNAGDILRLEAMLAWFVANPRSNLYPRQIPIAGVHSKWLEMRMPLIADLVSALLGNESGCGLREAPHILRFRILDDALRQRLGGIGDIAAPVDDISGLQLPVSRVYIVENLQTGLAFGDRPGSVVFMGLGYGITALTRLPWLSRAECIYWGDLDTHGFAILSRARSCLPTLASILMDEATLLAHSDLWVEENDQYPAPELPLLSDIEQQVYRGLKQQRWGLNVRLEQERIAWNYAWERLL
jgi:hypothetical protein